MSSRRRTAALVGRGDERAVLADALDGVGGGPGRMVCVRGEAGIGKSRLVEDFAVRTPELLAVTGGCVDGVTEGVAYAPWTELLWWLIRSIGRDALGPERARLARLLPGIGDAEGEDPGRAALFEAIVEVLHRVASERRLLVVVEDVHWIDPASRDVLAYVARNLRRLPLLLVFTLRTPGEPVEVRDLLGELTRLGAVDLTLDPLADADTADVAALLAGWSPDGPETRAVVARAGGNPLFVEELVAAGTPSLPPTVRHLMLGRTAGLDADARRLVETAAVIGARVPRALLGPVCGLPTDVTRRATRAAVDAGVLLDDAGRGYAFAHTLLRDAVLDELLADERVAIHAAVARALDDPALAAAGLDLTAERARHWDAAEQPDEALRWSIAAARQAADRYAADTAHAWFERALVWWSASADPAATAGSPWVDLAYDAADAAGASGAYDRAAELAAAAAATATDPASAAEAFVRAADHFWAVGRADAGHELAAVALGALDALDDDLRGRFLTDYVSALLQDARPLEAHALLTDMLESADRTGDPALMAEAHDCAGSAHEQTGDLAAAREHFEAALAILAPHDLAPLVARCTYNYASTLSSVPHRDEALALLDRVDGLVESRGIRRLLVAARTLRATEMVWAGDLAGATEVLAPLGDLALEGVEEQACAQVRALAVLHAGRPDAVEGLDAGGAAGGPAWVASGCFVRAEAAAWAGDVTGAATEIDRARAAMVGRLDPYWSGFVAMTGVRIEADRVEDADGERATAIGRADEIAAEWSATCGRLSTRFPMTEAQTAAVAAERARLDDDPDAGAAAARAAADAFSALGMPYLAGVYEWREGCARLAAGDRSGATRALSAVDRRARAHGFGGIVGVVEATARAARLRLGREADAEGAFLSERELEVLGLLAEGLSNPEIADRLVIGRRTVRAHVSNILLKLGAAGRAEAVSIAHRRGIL
ncbi:MAG: AAA family ATPase [Actinomycetota bacterium]